MVPFPSPHGMPCSSVMLISCFWQLLADQIPSAGKKHPTPGIWSPSKLTLHLLSLLCVLLLPASSSPAPSAFYILCKHVGSKHTQNVIPGAFCPYLHPTRLQESEESRNRTRKAIWICGLSFVLWRCILFFTCLFCSFPDPFLEACHTRWFALGSTVADCVDEFTLSAQEVLKLSLRACKWTYKPFYAQ